MRTVTVVEPEEDTTPPVISINGSNPMTIIQGETYTELGATATDNVDGTVAVTTSGNVDTDTVATYTITYTATDAAVNSASETRTVYVIEAGSEPFYGPELVLGGGNDSGILDKSKWVSLGNTYNLGYRVYNGKTYLYPGPKDNDGGSYQAIATTIGTQYQVSAILLGTDVNANEIFHTTRASYLTIDSSVPITSAIPDHSSKMVIGSTETTESFTFTATTTTSYISVRSTNGYNYPNARAISVKEVLGEPGEDTTPPVITLNGANPMEVRQGDIFTDPGATATDDVDGDITANIVIDDSAVDTNTAGNYTVTYNVSDIAGNAANQVTRTVIVTVDPVSNIQIVNPARRHIQTGSTLAVTAEVIGIEDSWGVKFILDEGEDSESEIIDKTEPFNVTFTMVAKGEHSIDAYVIDNFNVVQPDESNHNRIEAIGVGDIYVAIGDSITEGQYDDIASDDTSLDGRNTGGGFEPILNNLLTFEKGYPHSIYNEGLGGELSRGGLQRMPVIINKYPDITAYLLMYGTNDAAWWESVPSGLGLSPRDDGYSASFKDNIQQMIYLIKNDGKEVILAKIPRVLGATSGSNVSADPDSLLRNINIREYNDVIDELVSENNIIAVPPDFYFEFENTYGDGPLGNGYFDPLHPNGEGYNSMAQWWADTLY